MNRMKFSAGLTSVACAMFVALAATTPQAVRAVPQQQPDTAAAAPKPQQPGKAVIRGCLTGSKLTHIDPIEPQNAASVIPDNLKVTSLRVIRDQVKALDGHEVEVIGTLRGIPALEQGVLLSDSPSAKVYVGGGDKNLGEDLHTARVEPPTIYVRTIKDLAEKCTAPPAK